MKIKRLAAATLVLAAVTSGLLYWAWPELNADEPWSVRKARFSGAAKRAEPLIEAIAQYTSSQGHSPKTLDNLVPTYLDNIPSFGLEGCKKFKYFYFGSKQPSIIWYDLGSRHGKPMSANSAMSEGNPGHAILTFTLNQDDSIMDARFHRMPKEYETVDFDLEKWKAKIDRVEMAGSLPELYAFARMPRSALEQILGPPDGIRALRDTPWELRINCPRGLLNRDVFFYWPTESYPERIYSGGTERIGSWAFVHE